MKRILVLVLGTALGIHGAEPPGMPEPSKRNESAETHPLFDLPLLEIRNPNATSQVPEPVIVSESRLLVAEGLNEKGELVRTGPAVPSVGGWILVPADLFNDAIVRIVRQGPFRWRITNKPIPAGNYFQWVQIPEGAAEPIPFASGPRSSGMVFARDETFEQVPATFTAFTQEKAFDMGDPGAPPIAGIYTFSCWNRVKFSQLQPFFDSEGALVGLGKYCSSSSNRPVPVFLSRVKDLIPPSTSTMHPRGNERLVSACIEAWMKCGDFKEDQQHAAQKALEEQSCAWIKSFPEDPQAKVFLGLYHLQAGELSAAKAAFLGAERDPLAIASLAWLAMTELNFESSRSRLEALLKEAPFSETLWRSEAQLLHLLGDHEAEWKALETSRKVACAGSLENELEVDEVGEHSAWLEEHHLPEKQIAYLWIEGPRPHYEIQRLIRLVWALHRAGTHREESSLLQRLESMTQSPAARSNRAGLASFHILKCLLAIDHPSRSKTDKVTQNPCAPEMDIWESPGMDLLQQRTLDAIESGDVETLQALSACKGISGLWNVLEYRRLKGNIKPESLIPFIHDLYIPYFHDLLCANSTPQTQKHWFHVLQAGWPVPPNLRYNYPTLLYADCLSRLGHVQESSRIFQEILKKSPQDLASKVRLAEIAEMKGHGGKARQEYVELAKHCEKGRYMKFVSSENEFWIGGEKWRIALGLRRLGETTLAQKLLEPWWSPALGGISDLATMNSGWGAIQPHAELGDALEALGTPDEIVRFSRAQLAGAPFDERAWFRLGRACLGLGRRSEAEQCLVRLKALDSPQAAELERALKLPSVNERTLTQTGSKTQQGGR